MKIKEDSILREGSFWIASALSFIWGFMAPIYFKFPDFLVIALVGGGAIGMICSQLPPMKIPNSILLSLSKFVTKISVCYERLEEGVKDLLKSKR